MCVETLTGRTGRDPIPARAGARASDGEPGGDVEPVLVDVDPLDADRAWLGVGKPGHAKGA